ncbi:alpha-catulin-like isoform X2 [Apostichopus japonicus]|uniref:alpha-catulin-like isoform X2 n=1 Tax=Stichopus japonicus TaxID=307972 RepID=UPI003AB7FFC8
MAKSPSHLGYSGRSLEIRTRSIEQTLVPLVSQITTLVNHREVSKRSERTCRAIERIGQAVSLAVERFVNVGEALAEEHHELREEMFRACQEARLAGANIAKLTDISFDDTGQVSLPGDKNSMVRAARGLLSAVTRVLLIGDQVTINQIMASRSRVKECLKKIEVTKNFSEFVQCFSHFGKQMVALAHLTGDRQVDLKDEKQRAKMASSRATLEKSTMLLLTSCKTHLRHPESQASRLARDGIISSIHSALDTISSVVEERPLPQSPTNTCYTNGVTTPQKRAHTVLKEFLEIVEGARVTLADHATREKLQDILHQVNDSSQDFTDSAYTSHEHREKIIQLGELVRVDLQEIENAGKRLDKQKRVRHDDELDSAILKISRTIMELRKQLQSTAIGQAADIFRTNEDHVILTNIREAASSAEKGKLGKLSEKFHEHSDQVQDLCRLLSHITPSESLTVCLDMTGDNLRNLAPLVTYAASALLEYPSSKIAKENLDILVDTWEAIINDLSSYVKEMMEVSHGKINERRQYMSLPRPGSFLWFDDKHGTTVKSLKPSRLDAEEQTNIAKSGLELKLLTSELDAEADRWSDQDNDIIRRARNLSSMAYAMHMFSSGQGSLRTTQDLFKQAEYFAEEGNKLFRCVRDTTFQAPDCQLRSDLVHLLDRVLSYCQQLLFITRTPATGKVGTFNKVDSTIQDTKLLLTILIRILPLCNSLASQYHLPINRSPSLRSRPSHSNSSSITESRTSGDETDSMGSSGNSDGSYKRAPFPMYRHKLLHNSHSLDRP